jgi:hypothetical protein
MYYKIQYYSTKAVGVIPANLNFWFWLDANFAESNENVLEQGIEDGYQNFIPTFRKSTKTYTLETNLIPENLIDAINRMKYFETKEITMPDGTVYTMNNVKTEMNYPFDDKCYAIAKIIFDIDEVLVVTGC